MPINLKNTFVVILAGGKTSEEVFNATGIRYGADMIVSEASLFDRTLNAVREAGRRDPSKILALGPGVVKTPRLYDSNEGFNSLSENVKLAIRSAPDDTEWLLLCATDMPFVMPGDIQHFLWSCKMRGDADIYYPIAPVDTCSALCPGMRRTTFVLGIKSYTGGNVMLVRKSALAQSWSTIEELITKRKSKLELAKLAGMVMTASVLLGYAHIPLGVSRSWAERVARKRLKAKCAIITCPNGNLAVDLDRTEHWLTFARQYPKAVDPLLLKLAQEQS